MIIKIIMVSAALLVILNFDWIVDFLGLGITGFLITAIIFYLATHKFK